MRFSTPQIVPSGTLAARPQPTLMVDDELAIRAWHRDDAPAVIRAFADADIRFWHSHLIDTTDEAIEWIEATHQKWSAESSANWAIGDRRTDVVLGRAALTRVVLHEGFGEVAYWVLPEARGTGVASRASAVVVDWAFAALGLHRLEIEHSAHNPASCSVADRLGFASEGTRRSARMHPDGWHDMHVHGRIAPG